MEAASGHDSRVITLFWSSLREEASDAYRADLARMRAIAAAAPGFVSTKTYVADDGDRLTVVVFDSPENQAHWRAAPEHVLAQERGRARYYDRYRLALCRVEREWSWQADLHPRP